MPNPEQTHKPGQQFSFRCSEVHPECNWQTSGNSEDQIMSDVERHGREKHNLQNFDQQTRNKVKGAIHRRAA